MDSDSIASSQPEKPVAPAKQTLSKRIAEKAKKAVDTALTLQPQTSASKEATDSATTQKLHMGRSNRS